MPKRSKPGPPYTDIPKEIYVVVTNPWGMNSNPRSRGPDDFKRIAAWAKFALQQAGLSGGRIPTVECIYGMGTRDEIIMQFAEGTDIVPLLGKHRWATFANQSLDPNDPRSTCVFLYNWKNNGDPANHNWTENYPINLPLDKVPAKSPYPAPSWTSPPSTLTNLVLPIPQPPIALPIPDRVDNPGQKQQLETSPLPSTVTPTPEPPRQRGEPESGERPVTQDPASTSLFTPYAPPSQHPSHAQFLDQSRARCDKTPSLPPSPKFIKKLDPYELDEDALNILRAPNPEEEATNEVKSEDIKPTVYLSVKAEIANVKTEDDEARQSGASGSGPRYQPSQALIEAFNSLRQPEQTPSSARPPTRNPRRQSNAASEIIPPASLGYQPSAELEADINAFLLGKTATALALPSGSDTRATPGAHVAIKREYEDDVATSLGEERKKIKTEECY